MRMVTGDDTANQTLSYKEDWAKQKQNSLECLVLLPMLTAYETWEMIWFLSRTVGHYIIDCLAVCSNDVCSKVAVSVTRSFSLF